MQTAERAKPGPKTVARKLRSFRLSDEAMAMLEELAKAHGFSMTSVLEAFVRRDHARWKRGEPYVLGDPPAYSARIDGAMLTGDPRGAQVVKQKRKKRTQER